MESCPICGFAWELVPADAVGPRIGAGVRRIVDTVDGHAAAAARRADTDPARWSMLEYAAHVRDVLLHVRDRLVIALVEDDPDFKPLYRDQRIDLGLYAGDGWPVVREELSMSAALFARTFARVPTDALSRPLQYAYPVPATRTVLWMAQQVVHEVEHHASDIELGATLV